MVVFAFAPLLLALGLALALSRRPEVRLTPEDAVDLTGVRRHRLVAVVVGPLAALALGAAVLEWGPGLGFGLGLAAPLAASSALLALLAVVCASELSVTAVPAPVRTAVLTRRRPADLVPRGAALLAGTGAAALAVLLGIGWAMGDPDDLGRAGRSLNTVWVAADGARMSSGHGPWPGSFYAVPMLIVLLVAVALTAATVAVVVRRPQPSARSAAADLALRRGTVASVLHASAALSWLLVLPVALFMVAGLFGVGGAPGWYAVLGWACVTVALAAGLLGSWSLGRALVQPRVVVDRLALPVAP